MNGRCSRAVFWAGLFAAILGAMAVAACADTREEIIDRMAKRLPDVKEQKAKGKIGETFDGLVNAVKAEYLRDKALKKLVTDENADRKAFYAMAAEKYDATPEAVALSAGRRNFRAARPADWLKPRDGAWVQKKDLKE